MKSRYTSKSIWLFITMVGLLLVVCAWFAAPGYTYHAPPAALYRQSLTKALSQADRWELDFIVANEASMREHNSRRFDAPGSFEKRAEWFDETARTYQIADLMRQMIDFRTSTVLHNEAAFNQLFDLGKAGDIGASCMAWMFYRHHQKDITRFWKYSYETVAREALKHKDSDHPICVGMEGEFYFRGELGYPKDLAKALTFSVKSAGAGFYGSQKFVSRLHQHDSVALQPRHFELYICWNQIAYQQAPLYPIPCEMFLDGQMFYGGTWEKPLNKIMIPTEHKNIAKKWCTAKEMPAVQSCIDLENQLHSER